MSDHAEVWEKVVRKIRTGRDASGWTAAAGQGARPTSVASWLEAELDRAALEHPNPGRPTLHRLNRVEYRNAIRDLLALEIDAASLLPADNAAYGFDNNADALSLSPALTERYLGAAAKISQMALGRVRGSPSPETIFVPTDRNQGSRFSDDLPWGSRGGLAIRYYFPVDGEYLFELRLKESGADGGIMGLDRRTAATRCEPRSRQGLERRRSAGPNSPRRAEQERTKKILEALQFRVPVKAGSHLVQVYFVQKTVGATSKTCSIRTCAAIRIGPATASPGISSVTIHAVAGSARRLRQRDERFAQPPPRCSSASPRRAADEAPCARKIISTLARRAYRRPVTDDDLQIAAGPISRGRQREGRLRVGPRAGDSQHPREPEVPVPIRESAGERRAEHAVSHHRPRAGLAPVVLPVEQHPG